LAFWELSSQLIIVDEVVPSWAVGGVHLGLGEGIERGNYTAEQSSWLSSLP